MKKIGITGGIGSGKSTVCKLFSSVLGVPIFNTDLSARKAEEIDGVKEAMAEIVGAEMLVDGHIDRAYLRSKAFTNSEMLDKITRLIGKHVMNDLAAFTETNKAAPYILVESAILYESGLNKEMDIVIAVTAKEETRLARAMARDKATEQEVLNKINNQFTDKYKCDLADFVIYNEGLDLIDSYDSLMKSVLEIHNNITNETINKE